MDKYDLDEPEIWNQLKPRTDEVEEEDVEQTNIQQHSITL
jgi:hypothetical protein